MITLIVENWPVFLVAFLIGVATAWWVWARYRIEAVPAARVEAQSVAPKPVVPEPVAAAPVPLMDTAKVKAAPKPKAAAPKAKVQPVAAPVAVPKPKVASVPKPKVAPAPKPKAAPKPKPAIPDNLELMKGVGPKLNSLLKSLGITTFAQVANWSAADVAEVDSKLGNFAGRISRDNWVDQAKLLVAGDIAAFEKKYGSLGSEINKG
ncbi:MAG: hypothetical protein ACRCY3_05110 [Sphingorhabdus sp.]